MRDRRAAAAALKRLNSIAKQVTPRMWAATFGCLWNRWPTARRRQILNSKCLLGCEWGEDSIEHYSHCRQVQEFATGKLHLQRRYADHQH